MRKDKLEPWSRFRLAFALIIFDAFTKAAAFHLFDAAILNRTGLGGADANITELFRAHSFYPICFALSAFGSILVFSLLTQQEVRRYLRWILAALVFPISFIMTFAIAQHAGLQRPDPSTAIILTRLIFVGVALVPFTISHSRYFITSFGLVFSGAFGNFLSFAYPPFKIVDFIELPFGGIRLFNIADICVYIGICMLCASPLYFLIIHTKKFIYRFRDDN